MHEPAGVVEILVQILQFTVYPYSEEYPPPWKLKFRQILALWLFSFRITPPLPGNWNLGRSWHFDYSVSEYPPPQNWNLGRSWHFNTFQFQNTKTPPPPQTPTHPKNLNLGRSWHFKTFQFQNISYQWETMCGKLPHVETLSSPENYSFWSMFSQMYDS